MLDCCLSLDLVQQKGITFEQFANVAACNNLDANVVRIGHGNATVEDFRDLVKEICMGSGRVLISHYGRNGLKQPGIGHFSPLGNSLHKNICQIPATSFLQTEYLFIMSIKVKKIEKMSNYLAFLY